MMESGKVYRSETREPHHMYVLNLRKGAEMSVIFVDIKTAFDVE